MDFFNLKAKREKKQQRQKEQKQKKRDLHLEKTLKQRQELKKLFSDAMTKNSTVKHCHKKMGIDGDSKRIYGVKTKPQTKKEADEQIDKMLSLIENKATYPEIVIIDEKIKILTPQEYKDSLKKTRQAKKQFN
jgi:hypothetical protein